MIKSRRHTLAQEVNFDILDEKMNRFLAVMTYLLPSVLISAQPSEFQVIRVLWTADLHCQVLPTTDFASAGLPRRKLGGWSGLARLIKEKRDPGSLLLDNGDFGFGSPEGDSSQGRLAVWFMNRLGYDGAVLGARDFVGGMNNLEVLARYASFPILGDPMLDVLLASRVPIFRPYLIKQVRGVKVGIIGITDPEVVLNNRKADIAQLVIDEPRRQVARYLPAVKAESAEVIIVLGHIDVTTARSLVESLPGIDLIICRSERDRVEGQLPQSGCRAVVVGGVYGQRLGVADILFHKTERRVYAVEAEVINVSPELGGEDSLFAERLISGLDRAVVNNQEEFFPNEFGRVKLAQLVAEAVRQVTGVDLVVLPSWVIESGLEKGVLTRRHLYNAVPYREKLRLVTLPESSLVLLLTPLELDTGLSAPAVAGADLFVRRDARERLRIADLVRFRLRDRRKGIYRVATTETWLERTAVKEKGVIFPENLTEVWLKFAEKMGYLKPVPPPKLYSAPFGLARKSAVVGLIDINRAPAEVLTQLPGIGPKTAQRIVEYREREGKFKSIEELMNVPGIGPKKYEKIKNLITAR